MKILLHMGQGKTGTSALQRSLHTASDRLRSKGVLYPRFSQKAVAHHMLLPLCGCALSLPRWSLEDMGGPEISRQTAEAAWNETCNDVRQNRPDLLVLSSEFLNYRTQGNLKPTLAGLLSELSGDVTPILYVRNPVDDYRARLQQWLKQKSNPLPPTRMPLREAIALDEAVFPSPVQLIAFDRSLLHGGDIIQDFSTRFLAPWVGATELPAIQANVGLSAEALVLMARLRAEGGNTDETARRVNRLIPFLEKFDRAHPPAGPLTLFPEVAEAALRASTCHRWLAETGRLHIAGLDVEKIDGAAVPDWLMTAPPETMFPHDPDRLDHLRQSLEQAGSRTTSGKSPHLRTTRPAPHIQETPHLRTRKSTPRIQDWVLRFLRRHLASFEDRSTGAAPTRTRSDGRSPKGDRNDNH
jgi:hypothetical protein